MFCLNCRRWLVSALGWLGFPSVAERDPSKRYSVFNDSLTSISEESGQTPEVFSPCPVRSPLATSPSSDKQASQLTFSPNISQSNTVTSDSSAAPAGCNQSVSPLEDSVSNKSDS